MRGPVIGAVLLLAACDQAVQAPESGQDHLEELRQAVLCKAVADWKLPSYDDLQLQPGEVNARGLELIDLEMVQAHTGEKISELADAGDVAALRVEAEAEIAALRDVHDLDERQQGLRNAVARCVDRYS